MATPAPFMPLRRPAPPVLLSSGPALPSCRPAPVSVPALAPAPARARVRLALAGLLALAGALPQAAHALPAEGPLDLPSGPVVLSVGGALRLPNKDGRAVFDMAMLERLPQHSFSTQTPWYPKPRKFTGPLLRDVLAAAGAQGHTLEARAVNDYKVTIPVEDSRRYDVIVARLMDDKPMPLRDKGPLFIIYPFDRHAELRNSIYYGRSAWQLKSMELR